MATLIPTSPTSALFTDTAKKYNNSWVTNFTKPSVVNVFYVDHKGHRVWRNYERYLKDKGNQQYMWHGTTRACNIGDDNTQLYACHRTDCGVCNILRNTLDPTRAKPSSMYGIGAYVAPNSSKSVNTLYTKNASHVQSRDVVLLRCAVALGREYPAYTARKGKTGPPSGYDSVTGVTKANGGAVEYPESVVFTKDAILPVQLLVLRYPSSATRELRKANQIGNISNSYSSFNRRLINNSDANWNSYVEAIRDTYKGEVLWTDGNDGYRFQSAPNIRAYKVVRRNPPNSPNGTVVAEGYASSNPFYFRLA